MPNERLQKLLAQAGLVSRRSAEALIRARRVTVNGRVAHLGQGADPAVDRIEVDGRAIRLEHLPSVVWMLHKPPGYVVSRADERGRPTIYDLLRRAPPGLRYVGRLDRDSEGLLLLTTDGQLAYRLSHPRYEVPRTYEVEVEGTPRAEALRLLRSGVPLDDGVTAPVAVEVLARGRRGRLRLTLREGRKREVRRMLEAVGTPVVRLVRVEFGGVSLGKLAPGAARPVTVAEERRLRAAVRVDAGEEPSVSSSAAASTNQGARSSGATASRTSRAASRSTGQRRPGRASSGARSRSSSASGSSTPG